MWTFEIVSGIECVHLCIFKKKEKDGGGKRS